MNTAVSYPPRKFAGRYFKTSFQFDQPDLNIDEQNGIIKNVSLCTAGEAKGHDVFLDQSFIEDVVRLGGELKVGLKSRFGHPMLSSEALGTYIGRFKNFRVKGEKALADLYLDDIAKRSPNGDLYSYVIEMAKKNPDQFGASIVFEDDGLYQIIDGKKVPVEYDWKEECWKLSDPEERVYISIKALFGADLVDEPAANEGLFSSKQFNADKFAVRLTEFLDNNPDVWQFIDKYPDKFKPFLEKYNAYKFKLQNSVSKFKAMPIKKTFFQRLAAAFQNEEALSQIDAVTTDGQNIRIDAANDAPSVGDPVYIVDTETDETSVAPDGDYTIAGGDYDGYKVTVVDGKITAVFNPAIPAVETQQSAIKNYKELQAENNKMKGQLSEFQKKFSALEKEFDAFKKKPLASHTNVIADDDPEGAGNTDKQFFDKPWNKKARRKSA